MVYSKDFSVDSFEFWSGAKDTVAEVRRAGKMDELQSVIETAFECDAEPPTDTQINDFVWFERDLIYSQLGINLEDEPCSDE